MKGKSSCTCLSPPDPGGSRAFPEVHGHTPAGDFWLDLGQEFPQEWLNSGADCPEGWWGLLGETLREQLKRSLSSTLGLTLLQKGVRLDILQGSFQPKFLKAFFIPFSFKALLCHSGCRKFSSSSPEGEGPPAKLLG